MPLLLNHLVAVFLAADSSHFDEASPALLRHWANNSVSILDTYHDYREAFQDKRRKRYDSATGDLVNRPNAFLLMADFDIRAPVLDSGTNVLIRTTEGDMRASINKLRMAYHIGYLAREKEFGVYGIADLVSLDVAREDVPGREYLFAGRGENEVFGFSAGYVILAAFWRGAALDFNLGVLDRQVPKTTTRDSGGVEVFRFELEDGMYEGTEQEGELFLDVGYRQYSLNSLYSLRDKLEFLGLSLDLEGEGLRLTPFFRYARYRGRFQAGASLAKDIREFFLSRMEVAGDMHEDAAGSVAPYYHVLLESRGILFRLPRSRLSEFSGHDYHLVIDHAVSASTDALDAFALGTSAGVSFEDMLGLFTVRLGGGYNEYGHLTDFPIRDRFIIDTKVQIAW